MPENPAMAAADFDAYWRASYPEAPPMSYLLRTIYPERWVRVHSLPDAQRYARTEADWRELLGRQRVLFADLVGDPADLVLVTGDYVFGVEPQGTPPVEPFVAEGAALRGMAWAALPAVPLSSLPPDPHTPDWIRLGEWYRPAWAPYRWTATASEGLLRDIARGVEHAFSFPWRRRASWPRTTAGST